MERSPCMQLPHGKIVLLQTWSICRSCQVPVLALTMRHRRAVHAGHAAYHSAGVACAVTVKQPSALTVRCSQAPCMPWLLNAPRAAPDGCVTWAMPACLWARPPQPMVWGPFLP